MVFSNKVNYLLLALALLITIAWHFISPFRTDLETNETPEISSFMECVDAGFPVLESYPRQCRDDLGNLFNEKDEIEQSVSIANPASVFCTEQEGKLEIRDSETGQSGFCVFDNNSECEEWAFFRGECSKHE